MAATILPLDPWVLHGGKLWVELPAPPPGSGWRIEWASAGDGAWQTAAEELGAGSHLVPDLPPVPQREARWRAVAVEGPAGDGVFAPATRRPDREAEARGALRCHRCRALARWHPWDDVWLACCAAHAPENDHV